MTNPEGNDNLKSTNNGNILLSVIIVLLIIISVLGFFLWKKLWWENNTVITNPTNNKSNTNINTNTSSTWAIEVTVYEDKRCNDCNVDQLISQLKQIPALSQVNFIKKDFSDEWTEQYLKDNSITLLPAIIFNRSYIDPSINSYLTETTSWEYTLLVWASFDPYAKRSDKWFLIVDKEKIKEIKSSSYIKWNTEAKITWLEYSDLECPYCAQLHNSWTIEAIEEKYWDNINLIYNHFPLEFHNNAQVWWEIIECAWEQKGSDIYYKLLVVSFKEKNSTKSFLIDEVVKLWANKESIEKCLSENRYTEKVKNQMATWRNLFSVQWTPWNIIINNETWEYSLLSWAYPTNSFITIIDKLLSE